MINRLRIRNNYIFAINLAVNVKFEINWEHLGKLCCSENKYLYLIETKKKATTK